MTYTWLLPEYIEDILPPDAWRIDSLRRSLLDLFRSHGYQLVMPPLLEYVESLLSGTGHEMDLATFKLVDQLNGRHMGLRADITPQTARIDSHLMNHHGVNRLCYAGSVVHTLPEGLMRTREPLIVGAELFGHAGIESDLEIQLLLLQALTVAGVREVTLDLGHVAIFRSLTRTVRDDQPLVGALFRALQDKDAAVLSQLTRHIEPRTAAALRLLPELNGGEEILARARSELPADAEIHRALGELEVVARASFGSESRVLFDLAELPGYQYHTGIVFAAYAQGYPDQVARGGRYDGAGKAFGRARPATGFSMDVRDIVARLPAPELPKAIFAPANDDAALAAKIDALRTAGEIVIVELPGGHGDADAIDCERRLAWHSGVWQVIPG